MGLVAKKERKSQIGVPSATQNQKEKNGSHKAALRGNVKASSLTSYSRPEENSHDALSVSKLHSRQ
jgi:hypothetical protein